MVQSHQGSSQVMDEDGGKAEMGGNSGEQSDLVGLREGDKINGGE